MNNKAEEIIKNYEIEKFDELLKQFNSLKPRPFSGLISFAILIACMYTLIYFTDIPIFEGDYYWFFMAVIVVSGAIEGESRKINKRIDLLAKLINTKPISRENT